MKVTVVGKEFVSGTSKKTGKEFAANVIHITHVKSGVEGQAVDSIWLDPVTYKLPSIQVGAEYDLDRDGRGFVIGFDLRNEKR